MYDSAALYDVRLKMIFDLSRSHTVVLFLSEGLDTRYLEEHYPSIEIVRLKCFSLYPLIGWSVPREFIPTHIKLFSLAKHKEVIGRCDVLLASELYSWYSYSFFSQAKKIKPAIKCVAMVYETIPQHATKFVPPYSFCLRWLRKHTDASWAFTERTKNYLLHCGVPEDKIFVLYQGVTVPPHMVTRTLKDTVTILFCGRLIPEKGIMEIIDAFQKLANVYPHIRLSICGDGMLRPQIEALKDPRITIHGFVAPQQLTEIYRTADVFCLYSKDKYRFGLHLWEEQLGNVLIEAMAESLPIVVSGNGAIPEVVGEHNFLFYSDAELYTMLEKSIIDSSRRIHIGEANYHRAQEYFSLTKNTQALAQHLIRIALQ